MQKNATQGDGGDRMKKQAKEKTIKVRQITFRIDDEAYRRIDVVRREKTPYMKMNAFIAFCVYAYIDKDKKQAE